MGLWSAYRTTHTVTHLGGTIVILLADSKPLTDQQRQRLGQMLYRALLEIRILGWQGKAQQAADLADAFHNLPFYLWRDDFRLSYFRIFLEEYRQKYAGETMCDYVRMLDQIDNEEFNY